MNLKNAVLYYVVFAIAIFGSAMLLKEIPHVISPHFLTIYLFFTIITFIVFIMAYFGSKHSQPKNAINLIMVSFIFKLIASFLFFIILSSFTKDRSLNLVANFFSVYLLFTIFEIFILLAILRPDLKKVNTTNEAPK